MKPLSLLVLVALCACSQQPTPNGAASSASNAPAPNTAVAGTYTLDKSHASLVFRVSHIGFSHYTAQFKSFDAELQFDPTNIAASSVTAKIDPRSLEVNSPPAGFLDALLGDQWLNAAQFPEMSFKSTKLEATGVNSVRANGDFTLHGVTKPVALDITFNGGYAGHPMDPHSRIGFSAHGSFKRSDFGIAYGIPEPGSTMGVGDEVQFNIEAEFSGPPLANTEPSPTKEK